MAHYATLHCPITGFTTILYSSLYNAVNDIMGLEVILYTSTNNWETGANIYTDPTKNDNAPEGWYSYGGTIREGYPAFDWNGDEFIPVVKLDIISA